MNSFPMAPGHEIAGLVSAVGDSVTDFKVGDEVGVGCFVSSCRSCDICADGMEQHCTGGIQTYGSTLPEGKGDNYKDCVGNYTNGGYRWVLSTEFYFIVCIFSEGMHAYEMAHFSFSLFSFSRHFSLLSIHSIRCTVTRL
jgi:uncharacterized zinc-type alcohol dehydrogenase-like protein